MKTIKFTKSTIGYGLLFLLAIILRFYKLQIPFLGEKEAAVALQAFGGLPDFSNEIPGTSGFSAILSLVFFVLGKSEITARLIPAICGSCIILVPFFFRRILGKEAVIILSILLMFDPGLVAYSRQADGTILSICGLLFTFGFLINRKYIPAGITAGFALLGGPVFWPGLFGLGLALWLTSVSYHRKSPIETEEIEQDSGISKIDVFQSIAAMLLTVILIGSAFLTHLGGAAAPILSLTAYMKGWFSGSELSPFLMLFSFLLYQPFVLATGLFEGIRTSRSGDRINSFLMRWFLLAVLFSIFYPAREMDSLLFSYLPLLGLAARCILRIIQSLERPDVSAFGQMVLVILLIPFSWLNIIVLKFPIEGQEATLRAVASAGALALLIIATLLIRMGWPSNQTKTGFWMGSVVLIVIFSFSTAWRSAGLGIHPEAEVWNYHGVSDEIDLLKRTAGDLSEWNIGTRQGINIVILDYPSSALKWALREFTSVNEDRYLPSLSNPAIVITKAEQVPSLAEAYRGQDFVLTRKTTWSLILPEEWIKWFAFRDFPVEKQQIILWARTDLFPGAARTAPATINPVQ